MITLANAAQVNKEIDAWINDAVKLAEGAVRGISVEAFREVVTTSPQYSGDFAGNWKYSIGAPDISFEELGFIGPRKFFTTEGREPLIAGHPDAVDYAISKNRGRDTGYKLGQTIYISNSAFHDEPYAVKIETGQIKFRPGNQGAVVSRADLKLTAKYATLSEVQAKKLSGERL